MYTGLMVGGWLFVHIHMYESVGLHTLFLLQYKIIVGPRPNNLSFWEQWSINNIYDDIRKRVPNFKSLPSQFPK